MLNLLALLHVRLLPPDTLGGVAMAMGGFFPGFPNSNSNSNSPSPAPAAAASPQGRPDFPGPHNPAPRAPPRQPRPPPVILK